MLWAKLAAALLAFSGATFALMVLVLGFGVLEALICVIVLVAAILILMAREVRAPDLQMRESTWNTPDEEES